MATGANGRPELADVFFLLAVLAAAIGYAEGAALSHELGGWQTISWALVIGLPITVPVATISLVHHGIDHPQLSHWVALGYVSLFSMYLGFFAWYAGLHLGGVARVSQIQLLQPTLTLLWSALLLGETIRLEHRHGCARSRVRRRIEASRRTTAAITFGASATRSLMSASFLSGPSGEQ
ncbi:MAG: DMT family transporter [Acidimicrobiales bacterium]